MLFDLAQDLNQTVFSDWLQVLEFTFVDIAVCNKELRSIYLDSVHGIILHETISVNSDKSLRSFSRWVIFRNIFITQLSCFQLNKKSDVTGVNFQKLVSLQLCDDSQVSSGFFERVLTSTDKATFKTLILGQELAAFANYPILYELIANYCDLKHLTLGISLYVQESLPAIHKMFEANTKLESIKFPFAGNLYNGYTFEMVCKTICDFCPRLVSFSFHECMFYVANGIHRIIDRYPLLETLEVTGSGFNRLNKTTLAKISTLSHLHTLDLTNFVMNQHNPQTGHGMKVPIDNEIIEILRKCRQLKHINLSGTDSSREVIKCIPIYCKGLISLVLRGLKHGPIDDLVDIFKHCNQLQKLDLNRCVDLNNRIILAISTNCFQLTELNIAGWSAVSLTSYKHILVGCNKIRKLTVSEREFKCSDEERDSFFDLCPGLVLTVEGSYRGFMK